jgi:hypothetical protein
MLQHASKIEAGMIRQCFIQVVYKQIQNHNSFHSSCILLYYFANAIEWNPLLEGSKKRSFFCHLQLNKIAS